VTNVVTRPRRVAGPLFFGLLLCCLCGCAPAIGDVAGRVTYRGKTVVCGSVVLVGPDGMTKVGNISQDGSFMIKDVGAGKVGVAVFSLDPARPLDPYKASRTHGKAEAEPPADAERPADYGRVVTTVPTDRSNWADPNVDRTKWFPLPQKFERVDQSGVTIEIKAGANTDVNIDLQ
jgi:hypothetical protein